MSGQLPDGLNCGHFGNDLIRFILYQYHHQHVTQPLLLKQLLDLGVDISSGRLSTHIGNELFAWFSSTESKSRINFLSCLGQGSDYFYVLNAGAFTYREQQKLPQVLLSRFEGGSDVVCTLPLAHPEVGEVRIETGEMAGSA